MSSNFPPPENLPVFEIIWKYIAEINGSQMTIKGGAEKMRFACRATRQIYRHILIIFNNYCFSAG
jgi:hypothetical protein